MIILNNFHVYFRNWCLSRQIKWGHKIPAYCHLEYPEKWVAAQDIKVFYNYQLNK